MIFFGKPGTLVSINETRISCGGYEEFTTVGCHTKVNMCRTTDVSDSPGIVARITWQAEGWKYTKKYGWLCPKCAKAHTKFWKKKRGEK